MALTLTTKETTTDNNCCYRRYAYNDAIFRLPDALTPAGRRRIPLPTGNTASMDHYLPTLLRYYELPAWHSVVVWWMPGAWYLLPLVCRPPSLPPHGFPYSTIYP